MKARNLVGRTIVEVRQERRYDGRGMDWVVDALVLDDGAKLIPHAIMTDDDPIGTLLYVPPRVNPL